MNIIAAFITWDSDTMARAGLNTILGIGIVFCVLVLISFLISCFKLINKFGQPKQVAAAPVPTPVSVDETDVEDVTDDLEIVAVIMAAIEAYEEEMGGTVPADGLVVRSIKKVNKQSWQNA